ncbi:hypothetical protein TNCV_4967121 [Trichonephila clavipes]|nr:hypothetical protein TNCV_4967121 [Trichonephila clavipes]
MSLNALYSGLSRQRGYSTSRMASAFSDLNPIENVWDALRRQVAGRNYPPLNKNTLIRALTEEWDKLPQQLLDNVVQNRIRFEFFVTKPNIINRHRLNSITKIQDTTQLLPLTKIIRFNRVDLSHSPNGFPPVSNLSAKNFNDLDEGKVYHHSKPEEWTDVHLQLQRSRISLTLMNGE